MAVEIINLSLTVTDFPQYFGQKLSKIEKKHRWWSSVCCN
jgi:hypothetical protein